MSLVGKLEVLLITRTTQMEKGLKRGGTLASQFQKSILGATRRLVGFGLAAGGVWAVVRALQAGVRESDEFNKSLNFSLAILDKVNVAQTRRMRLVAQTASFGTRFKPPQAAKALFFLESAGFTAEQATEALPAALEFTQAAGGMFELSEAVDLLTDAQVALGLVTEDATENLQNMVFVSDKLVGANTLASATVQQFSEALTNKAAAAARQMGKSLSETLAVLAAFAAQGKKGADGGTALAIVWRDLRVKAIENEDAFRKMGIAVFDANDKMRSTPDIIKDMEDRFDGMSDKLKVASLLQLGFTIKTVENIAALIGMAEVMQEYIDKLDEMGGKTKEVSDRMQTEWETLRKVITDTVTFISRNTIGDFVERQAGKITKAGRTIRDVVGLIGRTLGEAFAAPDGERIPFFPDLGILDGIKNKYTEIADAIDAKLNPALDQAGAKAAAAAREMDTLGENVEEAIRNIDFDQLAKDLRIENIGDPFQFETFSRKLSNLDRALGLDKFDLLRVEVGRMVSSIEGLPRGAAAGLLVDIDRLETRQKALAADKEAEKVVEAIRKIWQNLGKDVEEFQRGQQLFAQQFETPTERFDRLRDELTTRLFEGQEPETIRRALVEGIMQRDAALREEQADLPPTGATGITQGTQAAFLLEFGRKQQQTAEKHLQVDEEALNVLQQMLDFRGEPDLTPAPIGAVGGF